MNSFMQTIALIELSITSAVVLVLILQKLTQQEFPLIAKISLILLLGNLFFWPEKEIS